ncbi:MAG: tyrosine-type recombinase/integrase [Xanthobacteraceae bacterium]|jgi:integrase
MARLLKYIDAVAKTGKIYFYFRRHGKRTPLPGAYNSPAFLEAYWTLRNGNAAAKVEIGASRTLPGTVNAAIAALYSSHRFTKNRPITQATDRNILEALRVRHGDKRVALLEQRHIEAMLAEKAGKPSAQRNLLRVLRLLLGFAVSERLRRDNPALGVKLDTIKTSGFHSWTEEDLRQFEARHPIGTKARLALDLLLYTAQRRSDAVRLGPPNIGVGENGGPRLRFTQSKTGSVMDIPIAEPLAKTIAATNMVGVKTYLITDFGRPFTPAGFGNWFRERCDEAGLPQCSAHGLRKAFLRRMAEAGCSEDFIASISGHRDMREIRTYVEAANRSTMATEGMAKTLARFPDTTEKS